MCWVAGRKHTFMPTFCSYRSESQRDQYDVKQIVVITTYLQRLIESYGQVAVGHNGYLAGFAHPPERKLAQDEGLAMKQRELSEGTKIKELKRVSRSDHIQAVEGNVAVFWED